MRTLHFLAAASFAALSLAAGCSVDPTDTASEQAPPQAERRQKIGKADLWGTCEPDGASLCGKKGTGNCYCDKACVAYGDCCADYYDSCSEGEQSTCEELGGSCSSQPGDPGFPALCEQDFGVATLPGACEGYNQACCDLPSLPDLPDCPTVMCALYCEYGFKTGPNGCAMCSCNDAPPPLQFCGGFGNLPCPEGKVCVDDPNDDCDPDHGGADCGGHCVDPPPPPAPTCAGKCGSAAAGKVCYCDELCSGYGDCCDDYQQHCGTERVPAAGACIKNSQDACTTDADCVAGGCGGELCFNPALGGGISTCECTSPTNVGGCGCLNGHCSWYN
jgi:hypothetical protein